MTRKLRAGAFTGADGANPNGVTGDANGDLFGIMSEGGTEALECQGRYGTVFSSARPGR